MQGDRESVSSVWIYYQSKSFDGEIKPRQDMRLHRHRQAGGAAA